MDHEIYIRMTDPRAYPRGLLCAHPKLRSEAEARAWRQADNGSERAFRQEVNRDQNL